MRKKIFTVMLSMKKSFLVFCLIVTLSFYFLAINKVHAEGRVTNGKQEGDGLEKKDKYISCVSNKEDASIFVAPDISKPFTRNNKKVPFMRGTSMKVDQIIDKEGGVQFLSGEIYTFVAGGRVLRNARSEKDYDKEEDKYRLYVLSEEWDCRLHNGLNK